MPSRIPHAFTQEIADTVCERLAAGESLKSVCDYLFDEIIEIADTPQLG